MNTRTKSSVVAMMLGVAVLSLSFASVANAQTATSTKATKAAAKVAAAMAKTIANADKEISRRISALNDLATRIANAKNVSDADKASIASSVQAHIADLNALKAKIDADTDATVLKADVKTIANSYRIFALVIPQGHLLASVDSVNAAATVITNLAAKLQTRVTALQTAGKDVTSMTAALTDLAAKVADAKTQAAAAQAEFVALKPDMGDKNIFASNTAALKDAQAKIKAASEDLKAARADAQLVVKAIQQASKKPVGNATSTAAQNR